MLILFSFSCFIGARATQDGTVVSDVGLPAWANGDACAFVDRHRAALESDHVSNRLHHWVDLVFGCKQRGAAALRANNEFHHLTYEGAVDVEAIADERQRRAVEAQIDSFGQTPAQLFNKPHPRRGGASEGATRRASAMRECALKLHADATGRAPRAADGTALPSAARFFPDVSAAQRRSNARARFQGASPRRAAPRGERDAQTNEALFVVSIASDAPEVDIDGAVAQINAEGVVRLLPRWRAAPGVAPGRVEISRAHHYAELPRALLFALHRAQAARALERRGAARAARPAALWAQIAASGAGSAGAVPAGVASTPAAATTLIAAVANEIFLVALAVDGARGLAPSVLSIQSFSPPGVVVAIAASAVGSCCESGGGSSSGGSGSSGAADAAAARRSTDARRSASAKRALFEGAARRAFATARAPLCGWLVAACDDGSLTLWPMLHRERAEAGSRGSSAAAATRVDRHTYPHVAEFSSDGAALAIGGGALCGRTLCGHPFERSVRAVATNAALGVVVSASDCRGAGGDGVDGVLVCMHSLPFGALERTVRFTPARVPSAPETRELRWRVSLLVVSRDGTVVIHMWAAVAQRVSEAVDTADAVALRTIASEEAERKFGRSRLGKLPPRAAPTADRRGLAPKRVACVGVSVAARCFRGGSFAHRTRATPALLPCTAYHAHPPIHLPPPTPAFPPPPISPPQRRRGGDLHLRHQRRTASCARRWKRRRAVRRRQRGGARGGHLRRAMPRREVVPYSERHVYRDRARREGAPPSWGRSRTARRACDAHAGARRGDPARGTVADCDAPLAAIFAAADTAARGRRCDGRRRGRGS